VKVTHVLQTNLHMYDPLSLQTTQTVIEVGYLRKRSHKRLSPRPCT